MPITVHRATPRQRKTSFSEQLGLGVGKALESGIQAYQQNQKQNQFSEAIERLKGAYNNPELNESQRLLQAYQDLSQFPEVAQQLGGQLSRTGANQAKALQGEQMNQAFQNIQNIYSDPNLSEDQKIFGVYQELNQNPTLAHNLLGSIQQQNKKKSEHESENVAADQFTKGYNAIVEGDNDSLKGVLQDPNTPLEVRKKLIDLRSQQDVRSSVNAKELRNRQSMVQNAYQKAITNERAKIRKPGSYPRQTKEEIDKISKNIKRLEVLQKTDLKRLSTNPDTYAQLKIWDNDASEYLPDEEGDENQPQDAEALLNSLSDDEIAELFYQSRGDMEKAKELALERYSR